MDNYMTLYCIRQKSTGFYLPIRESGYNNYSMVKPSGCLTPRLFRKVGYARICLDHWLKGICSKYTKEDMAEWQYVPVANRTKDDFDIVPVYVTISKLSVDDIADLDKHDADVKQRIKQLGLTCVRGGK
jgi:hypothetical protein